jgi:hypothetical protein
VPRVKATRKRIKTTRSKPKPKQLIKMWIKDVNKFAIAKATKTNTEVDRSRDADEAAPLAIPDTETMPES